MIEINMEWKIARPLKTVVEAVLNPEHMQHYFITSASGRLEEGKTIMWRWEDYGVEHPIQVQKVTSHEIAFQWPATGVFTHVTLKFTPLDDTSTLVSVNENGWDKTDQGIARLAENTKGWTAFLLGLKAYLEYNINLRK